MIETCHLCVCYVTLYSQVTPAGTAIWWTDNTFPSYLDVLDVAAEPEDPPTLAVLGPALPNQYLASAWDRGGSTLGGQSDWIQDSEHAGCPGCRQSIDYLGLIGGADLYDGEGTYYLHLHQPCGFAAVNYQQS